jgi:hypothetical protein
LCDEMFSPIIWFRSFLNVPIWMGLSIVASIRGMCITFMFDNCIVSIGQVYTILAPHSTLMKLITKENSQYTMLNYSSRFSVTSHKGYTCYCNRQTWRWHIMDCNYTLITCYNSKRHLIFIFFVGLDVRFQYFMLFLIFDME